MVIIRSVRCEQMPEQSWCCRDDCIFLRGFCLLNSLAAFTLGGAVSAGV